MKKNNPNDPIAPETGMAASFPTIRPFVDPMRAAQNDPVSADEEPDLVDPAVGSANVGAELSSEENTGRKREVDPRENPMWCRIEAPPAGAWAQYKAHATKWLHTNLPICWRRLRQAGSKSAAALQRGMRSLFVRPAHVRKQKKKRDRIRQTDRERVYKLRGYTTVESVIAKRKAQRRFRIAQRLTITLMCVGLLGYVVFRNNPFTDFEEWMRMVGIHKAQNLAFHQYAFPLVVMHPEPEVEHAEAEQEDVREETQAPVLSPSLDWDADNDFTQRIMQDGREGERFYILAYPDAGALKSELERCVRTIAPSDYAQLTADQKIGTVLVLLPKEGDQNTYRFSTVVQSGAIIDLTALPVAQTLTEPIVYAIGFLSEHELHGYSFDVEVQQATSTNGRNQPSHS